MIIKELDPFQGKKTSDFTGRKAEEEMAFKLKRRFYDNKELFVINNLRFDWLDSHVQIDHLILSRYGVIIIESKSVRSKVKYDGEQWCRLWDHHWIGMKNPVVQAEEQGRALKELLRKNHDKLLGKMIFGLVQKGFGHLPVQCFVAISDTGVLIPPEENDLYKNQVFKAELIPDKIEEYYKNLKHANSVFAKNYEPWDMKEDELKRVIDFLLSIHVPSVSNDIDEESSESYSTSTDNNAENQQIISKTISNEQEEIQSLTTNNTNKTSSQISDKQDDYAVTSYEKCPQCGGKISILWGAKYKNYYWHCDACNKNISINFKCPKCHEKLRIRKSGREYYIYCESCGINELYFTDTNGQ